MKNEIICLGIEGTAHTFSIAILKENGELIAEARDMYTPKEGGLIPGELAKHHRQKADEILNKALSEAKLSLEDIDLIVYSSSPGLPPSLHATRDIAVGIRNKINKPLLGVNHVCAHLEIGKLLTKVKDPVFVFTSGANTQIIAHEGGKYRIFGEALSIAVGNALDKFGRELSLSFPAGPKIEQLAKTGKYIELPYTVKGMDVEFSGLVTNAIQKFKQGVSKEDLCFSLQETAFAMLTEVTERAMAHVNKKEVLLIGGVAANQRFCSMLDSMCNERGAKFYACPMKWCGDNAYMIGWLGVLEYLSGRKQDKFDVDPRLRIDKIETIWIN